MLSHRPQEYPRVAQRGRAEPTGRRAIRRGEDGPRPEHGCGIGAYAALGGNARDGQTGNAIHLMAGASAPRALGDPANRVVVGTGGHDNPIDVKMSGSESAA